jgi:hypothetical protein
MNWRRGLFRLWIVGSALFVLAVAFVSYSDIRREFNAVGLSKFVLLPVLCGDARGVAGKDYTTQAGQSPGPWDSYANPNSFDNCWYGMSKFRPLYQLIKSLCIDIVNNIRAVVDDMVNHRQRTQVIHSDYLQLLDVEVNVFGRNREQIIHLPNPVRENMRRFVTDCANRKLFNSVHQLIGPCQPVTKPGPNITGATGPHPTGSNTAEPRQPSTRSACCSGKGQHRACE